MYLYIEREIERERDIYIYIYTLYTITGYIDTLTVYYLYRYGDLLSYSYYGDFTLWGFYCNTIVNFLYGDLLYGDLTVIPPAKMSERTIRKKTKTRKLESQKTTFDFHPSGKILFRQTMFVLKS